MSASHGMASVMISINHVQDPHHDDRATYLQIHPSQVRNIIPSLDRTWAGSFDYVCDSLNTTTIYIALMFAIVS